MSKLPLSAYKQQIVRDFNNRQNYENEFHKRAASRLLELAKVQPGQQVLDVATGTGLVAIAAAQIVGSTGSVLGTDLAAGMLQQAQRKAADLKLDIAFEEVDADEQQLLERHFDAILCSSAIVYFTDIPRVLQKWHDALKIGGVIAFSCLSEASPSASALFRAVVEKYGATIPNPNELLGTPEKCDRMLENIGFEEIEVTVEQFGFYLEHLDAAWTANAKSACGLQNIQWSDRYVEECKQEYLTQLQQNSTKAGYWNDSVMLFVIARKVT